MLRNSKRKKLNSQKASNSVDQFVNDRDFNRKINVVYNENQNDLQAFPEFNENEIVMSNGCIIDDEKSIRAFGLNISEHPGLILKS